MEEKSLLKKSVTKVCLVNVCDSELLNLLKKHYGCEIMWSDTGEEYSNMDDVVFIFDDFESRLFKTFFEKSPTNPIISAAVVRIRHRKGLELPFPRAMRPVYCELLLSYNIVLRPGSEEEKLLWIKLIRYMGGHVRREISARTIALVINEAKGKAFRQCVSLGQKVLLPSWLHDCWAHRDDFDFDCISEEMISKHRIGVFENLKIFVYGFNELEDDDIKKNISQNRGIIVADISEATHCVVNTSAKILNFPQLSEDQRIVTNEWVWTSINIQYCANEDLYHPGVLYSQNLAVAPSLSTAMTNRSCLPEDVLSAFEAVTVDKAQKTSKAFHVCVEIYETEVSYVNALKLLVDVKEELDLLLDKGVELLQKSEISLIFGKIMPIVVVHKKIIVRLKELLDNWKEDADVGKIWAQSFEDLNRVYAPYSNTYDTAVTALSNADKANPRLHAFLRAKECSKEFMRNSFKDLLIRPVQRIPTLIVLLKELEKRSERKSEMIKEAIILMDRVVSRANELRAQNDGFIEQISFFNDVQGVPAHIMCSRRKVLMSVEAISIGGTGNWQDLTRRKVKIILYNDMVMICLVRNPFEKSGTLNRLTRRASFAGLMEQRKPYKYYNHLLIPHVREVNRLMALTRDGSERDLELAIYCWTTRDLSSDSCWYVEAINKDAMDELVGEIHRKLRLIFMQLGRHVSWSGFVIDDMPPCTARDILIKHVKKVLPKSENLADLPCDENSSALSTFRRRSANGLRRTMGRVSSITRRSIPAAFRYSRWNTTNNKSMSVLVSSVASRQTSSQRRSVRDVAESLEMVEESEHDVWTSTECSDKEN